MKGTLRHLRRSTALMMLDETRLPAFYFGEEAVSLKPSYNVRVLSIKISRNTIALFIDGANLNLTLTTLGFDIDYKRLLSEFQSRGTLELSLNFGDGLAGQAAAVMG